VPAALCKLDFALQGLSLVFLGETRMRAINKKYLGHDYVADVLTFDLGESLGEIIICPRMAAANAVLYKTSTEKEIILYVIHGILHLKGFNDHALKDIIQMRKMENALL
jgi:rRNA maturation RNase YbeY